MKRRFMIAAAVISSALLSGVPAALGADAPLHVVFEPRAVTIQGISPNGEIVAFAIHRQQVTFQFARTSVWRLEGKDANGGKVRLTTPSDIEPDRLWIVVDQTTGRSVITKSVETASIDRLPPGLLKKQSDAAGDTLTVPLPLAHLLVVRPGEGAWLSTVGDGGGRDDDAAVNNAVRVRPEKLDDYHGKGKKNDKFRKDDLIVVIEPLTLRIVEERLK